MDVNGPWREPGDPDTGESSGVVRFTCQWDGFDARGSGGLLGSFDGRDARDLHAYAVEAGEEQLLVSMHELLHHELQWSTAWGLIAAMAGLLAAAGTDPDRLQPVADLANQRARRVHEVFATTISAGVLGVERSRDLLAGNRRYLRYLDEGLSLGGESSRWPWQFRESALQMLLRTLMQPHELLALASKGFEGITVSDLTGITPPDVRLQRAAAAGTWWERTFAEISDLAPGRGGDTGGTWARALPGDRARLEELKDYEETVLIPRLAATARFRLLDLGLPALDESEYLRTVEALSASFQRLAPADWQVETLTARRSMTQEPLGAERERIRLHEVPAVADITAAEDLADQVFVHRGADGVPAILATYLPGQVYATQFGLEELSTSPMVLALAGLPFLDDRAARHVPFALLNVPMKPHDVQQAFATLPVITLTSLSATRNQPFRDHVLDLDSAFVLIDLPLSLQIGYWADADWTVRFAAIDLRGQHGLTLLLFTLEELPGIYFLAFRSTAGFGELAQLLDRHPDHVMPGFQPGPDVMRAVTLISNWLLSAWWRFQETAD